MISKKNFTIMISVIILMGQANAVSSPGLRQAFEEFEYFVTVEWNQKDQNAYNNANQRFTHEIIRLQSEGLSNEDLIVFAIDQVKKVNPRKAEEIEKLFNLLSVKFMSADEVRSHISDIMKESSTRGASWNGDIQVMVGAFLISTILVASMIVFFSSQKGDPKDCKFTCKNGNGSGYCFELDANPGFCD